MEEFKRTLKQKLAQEGVEFVFAQLNQLPETAFGDHYTTFILIQSQWNDLLDDEFQEIQTSDKINSRKARIRLKILQLIDLLGAETKTSPDVVIPKPDNKPEPINRDSKDGTPRFRRILFLAANPTDQGKLRLGVEHREITNELERSEYRDSFELIPVFAARSKDLRRAILKKEPQIVHFSGHGFPVQKTEESGESLRSLDWEDEMDGAFAGYTGGVAIENDHGQTHLIKAEALGALFELIQDELECVVLNACYSQLQADEIVKYIPYVVGMKRAVPDKTAIVFATGFYDALGAGEDIPTAFKAGKVAIKLEGLTGADIPVLIQKA